MRETSETSEQQTSGHPRGAPAPQTEPLLDPPEPAASFSQPVKKRRRKKKGSGLLVICLLIFIAAVAATCYFGFLLLREPRTGRLASIAPRKMDSSASITHLATPAAEPTESKHAPTTLDQIAKMQAAKHGGGGGALSAPGGGTSAGEERPLRLDNAQVVEARELLAEYLQATTWRERLPFIFEPERCEAQLREYYETREQREPTQGPLLAAGTYTQGSSQVLNLRFLSPTWANGGIRANFHRAPGGRLLLDWESWVAWSAMTWPDFKLQRPQLPVLMRAVASESSYYNYEFTDNSRWLAVKLRSPDGQHNVTGYVERNSVPGLALANLIGAPLPQLMPDGSPMAAVRKPGSKALVTVRLAFPSGAQSDHCVNITTLLADSWLLFPGEGK